MDDEGREEQQKFIEKMKELVVKQINKKNKKNNQQKQCIRAYSES